MPRFTLKTKVTLIIPLVITIALACLLFLIHSLLQSYIKDSISRQQYQILSILADDIDQNVSDHHKTLQILAERVTKAMVDNPELALAYLRSQNEHMADFDNGMYLFDHMGRIIADTAQGLDRTGKDFSFRDYVKQTMATKKPFLSDPFESAQQHHHPVITFTAPIFGKDGSLLAILGGSVDLTRSTFVEKLSRVKLTKGGYVYLYNKDRMLISHPDKSRIMKRDVPLGVNQLFDRAIDRNLSRTANPVLLQTPQDQKLDHCRQLSGSGGICPDLQTKGCIPDRSAVSFLGYVLVHAALPDPLY